MYVKRLYDNTKAVPRKKYVYRVYIHWQNCQLTNFERYGIQWLCSTADYIFVQNWDQFCICLQEMLIKNAGLMW
jgi:hypothetical protein